MISIHALREEGDDTRLAGIDTKLKFLSTPSARRATLTVSACRGRNFKFLSTPSARRATIIVQHFVENLLISIHALREEGDPIAAAGGRHGKPFLSTPSARRATETAPTR